MPPDLSQFQALKRLILTSLDAYEASLTKSGLPEPSFDEDHPLDSPSHLASPELFDAQNTLIGALSDMQSLVEAPMTRISLRIMTQYFLPACLAFFVKTGLPDILNAAGPKGLSSKDLAAKIGTNHGKLIHILRYLANSHIISEVSVGVFANNRTSRLLVGDPPLRNWVAWNGFWHMPAVVSLNKAILEDPYDHSWEFLDCAAALTQDVRSKGVTLPFEYLVKCEPHLIPVFMKSMANFSVIGDSGVISDYPWDKLTNKTIVDVAGGTGTLLLSILKANPNLKGVLQDLPEMIALGRQYYDDAAPEDVKRGRVQFDVIDMFKEQPRHGPDYVYVLRMIIHDYPDSKATVILKQLASVMVPGSSIVIIDHILAPATRLHAENVRYPLLEGNSSSGRYAYEFDMCMVTGIAAQERTVSEFRSLAEGAGLRIQNVYYPRSTFGIIELVKV